MSLVIGIGGPSRSGKSILASKMKDQLSNKKVLLLDMDDFVFPMEAIPKIKGYTDWEHPGSMDFDLIISKIKKNKDNHDFIIVEGILAFANEALRRFYNLTISMQITKEIFLKRRVEETRWGEEPKWYLEHVWESYLRYGQYPEADFVLRGENEIPEDAINRILSRLPNCKV